MGGRGSSSGGGGGGSGSSSGGGGSGSVKMPELSGSEKQVAWAESLRGGAIKAADDYVSYREKMATSGPTSAYGKSSPQLRDSLYDSEATPQSTREAATQFKETLSTVTSASKIIDRRYFLSQSSVTDAIKAQAIQIDRQKRRGRWS